MDNKISCQLSPWNKQHEEGIHQIASAGYSACEIGSNILLSHTQKLSLFSEKLKRRKLSVSSVFELGHFENWQDRRRIYYHHDFLSKVMSQCDINYIILSPGIRRSRNPDLQYVKNMLKMITEINKRYEYRGIRVGIHPHLGSSIFTSDQINYLLENISYDIDLVPDIGHLTEAGVDVFELINKNISRIRHIHLKDVIYQPNYKKLSPLQKRRNTEFCELGKGQFNLINLIKLIKSLNYQEWFVVELENPSSPLNEAAINGIEYLKKVLGSDEIKTINYNGR